MDAIRNSLLEGGVPSKKINTGYGIMQIEVRSKFLRDFANVRINDIKDYAVAEGGVFQGEFAKVINECFPDSTIYLFDTFEGFNPQNVDADRTRGYSDVKVNRFSNTSVDLVMSKLPHPEKAIIRKGFFPETAKGLEDQKFFFVNLDFDLYQPILEGLRFFYPRLSGGGVLLIHDYFTPEFFGVAQAIKDFEEEIGHELVKLPIGDHCSLAIMRPC